jgi:hypothetical protein
MILSRIISTENVPDKSRHVSSTEGSIQGKKHVQFKGVKLMKTSDYILTQQDGTAVTNDLYTVGGSNFDRVTLDPRCSHASAHYLQANTETVISYDHKRLFSNLDSLSIHEVTVCHILTSYELCCLYRVAKQYKNHSV